MCPSAAIKSSVFWFYLLVAAVLLVVAGIVLTGLRWGMKKNVDDAWRSYLGWLVMIPLLGAAIFLGREVTIVFFTGVGLLGFHEFARATGLSADGCTAGGVYLGIVAAGVIALVPDPALGAGLPTPPPGWYDLFMTLPVFVVTGLLVIPILRNRFQGQLNALTLAIFGFIYFGWMCGHVAFLANAKHAYAYLIYLLFAVEVNDIAAFLAGRLFGRHALRSNISPKKTWEGSLGALAVSLALPWALWFTFPHLEPLDLLALGVIVSVGGQLGDLAVSVIKRDLGIKNMGTTIPGHGGILDRIDSLVYAAPLFFHYIRFRYELNPLP